MKKIFVFMFTLFALFPLLSCGDSSHKENPSEIDKTPTQDLVYKQEDNAYTVIDYTGEDVNIIIPEEHEGLPVTKIQGEYGTGAFARKNIVSVVLPNTITEIGQNSFHNCSALQTITISQNSNLCKIGNNAFSGNSSLKSIYIPAGMTELGDNVFNNCGSLESITVAEDNPAYRSENGHLIKRSTQELIRGSNNAEIPEGVKSIAQAAFRRTNKIEKLIIPTSVASIENYIIANSFIEVIDYLGTEAEWNKIEKSKMWNYGKENVQITFQSNTSVNDEKEINVMYLYINNNRLEVTLAENTSVNALVEILKKNDITYTATDYGNFEKVGDIGYTLPQNNTQITTQAGDVILYQGHNLCLYYDTNNWNFTRIGKINGYSAFELRSLLGAGNGSIQIRISLK